MPPVNGPRPFCERVVTYAVKQIGETPASAAGYLSDLFLGDLIGGGHRSGSFEFDPVTRSLLFETSEDISVTIG